MRVDGRLVQADHRAQRAADEVQLVLDDEVGRQVVDTSDRATASAEPRSAPTSRFHGIIANLSTVPITSDGRLA